MSEAPFDVLDDFPDSGDLSNQQGGDVIDPAKGVEFTIENVEPRVRKDEATGEKMTATLNVRVSIGPMGVDGSGKYAKKNLFVELMTWFNAEKYTSDWWKTQARFPYKAFLKALGYNPANPPKVSDSFLAELKGKRFRGDITKPEIRVKNDEGKYEGTGDFKNEVKNMKAIEV